MTEAVGLDKPALRHGLRRGRLQQRRLRRSRSSPTWKARASSRIAPDGNGGRRFVDVTDAPRLRNPHWGTSCGWGDIDGDGLLDLYVCNYVSIDLNNYKTCESAGGHAVIHVCPPTVFPVVYHRLFRNNGNGTFTDITASAGIGAAVPGGGLGVILSISTATDCSTSTPSTT